MFHDEDDIPSKTQHQRKWLLLGVGVLALVGGITGLVLGLKKDKGKGKTSAPSQAPSIASFPTEAPQILIPITPSPSKRPTPAPTIRTPSPTLAPSKAPIEFPSMSPTSPTEAPSVATEAPTEEGTFDDTNSTDSNSTDFTFEPTAEPTGAPNENPLPTASPSSDSSSEATASPTVAATAPEPINILPNGNFDGDTLDPWTPNGDTTIQQVVDETDEERSTYALVTDRDPTCCTWMGIAIDVTGLVEPGIQYEVSLWAKLANPEDGPTTPFYMKMIETDLAGQQSFPTIVNAETNGGLTTEWKYFSGYYTLDDDSDIASLILYAEGAENGWDFAIDDVSMKDTTPVVTDFYVSTSKNTEYITIPQPPQPDLDTEKENCPYLDSDLVSWETQFPNLSEGDDVTLPENSKILVAASVAVQLGTLTIPATSELIFAEVPGGITLDVEGIEVQGALIAGSETCRFDESLTITLHGERPEGITQLVNEKPRVYKGISVTGRIELHGKRFYRTWTRLAKRVLAGDTMLYLQDEVNWEAGQEIVLITTAMRDSRDWHQNELFTVLSVETTDLPSSEVKAVVTIDGEAQYDHIARPEYQAEVAMLSRTILIQGAEDDSPPTDASDETCNLMQTGTSSPQSAFGYSQVTCADSYLTGYGGHIMVHSGGVGYFEGVELYRMGQTNVKARYPVHFHLLADDCPGCYVKDCAFHESYYRCVSIHGTNNVTVSENVAFDVTGFCYYLEDGVEEMNTLSYNLVAHVHTIGTPATGGSQYIQTVQESDDLRLPADVSASGFYITNMHNYVIGNVAVGGWAGFAFPILVKPIGLHIDVDMIPASRMALEIDGNTAHSTAHFWGNAAAFYFGGALYTLDDGTQEYNAGRDTSRNRNPCKEGQSSWGCDGFNRITNSKVFQSGNVGLGSWSGRMEIINYECHDIGLSLEALEWGFWIDKMYVTCRTGETLALPSQRAETVRGNGLVWYDTAQDHIMTDSIFKNCGFRSDLYNQYDTSETRGCDSSTFNGCRPESSTFGLLTHSDQFNPEIMQATRNVTFVNAGRRFRFSMTDYETVSGRIQNWIDMDGTITELYEPSYIGSGYPGAGKWWLVEEDVFQDEQAPLNFIKKNNGPARGLAHIRLEWDADLHNTVGSTSCTNGAMYVGGERVLCPAVGHIRHLGTMFDESNDPIKGLPVTAQAEIAGLTGGFGWLLELDGGAPHTLSISQMDITEDTGVFLSIAYPTGTSFTVAAKAASWCFASSTTSCEEVFESVATVEDVRYSDGNKYHFDTTTGLLTIRVTQFPDSYTGRPDWIYYTPENSDLTSFIRSDVTVPQFQWHAYIEIAADCPQNGAYCSGSPPSTTSYDNVCSEGYEQTAYDQCCKPDSDDCEYPYLPTALIE